MNKLRYRWLIIVLLVVLVGCKHQENSDNNISIIPLPDNIIIGEGSFKISQKTDIFIDKKSGKMGSYLSELLSPATGFDFRIREYTDKRKRTNHGISLLIDTLLTEFGDEGYSLSIKSQNVNIIAATEAGVFYGIQSLRQLLPVEIENGKKIKKDWKLPCIEIEDSPRFTWRGLMIDCSRTFWSQEYIFKTIRLMSLFKMNTLHLHLTDDQGWRMEILKYPELAKKASTFPEEYNEPSKRQGFYTQYDLREIIAYGKSHNVTIVPEIEMPGHSNALLSVFPELSCNDGPYEIFPFFKGPGITEDILCAGKEETFEFLEDVLDEVIELFPGEFIHIGGDEAPKSKWEDCPDCQERMKQEFLDNENELQSYFIKRIASYIEEKGKRLIGWDEILEGGLAENATVISWRGTNGGIEAARSGHDVVMSPTSHCYFDYNYESISTKKAYSYNPVPSELSKEESEHILGAQANFWSHIDREEMLVDKQLYPRLCAISEVNWTAFNKKDFNNFSGRLKNQLSRLQLLGVNYYSDTTVINAVSGSGEVLVKHLDSPPNASIINNYPLVSWKEKIETPRPVQLHFIRLDLENEEYELFSFTGTDSDGKGPAEASLELPTSMAIKNSAIVAINANAFRHLADEETNVKRMGWFEGLAVDIAGLVISDGQVKSETEEKRIDFWIDKNAKPKIGKLKNTKNAVQGLADWGSLLLKNDEIMVEQSDVCHPRTMIGSDKKGKHLFFVVADGRQKGYSEGITLFEAAEIMKNHGCYNAINLDGGGSSIMLVEKEGELVIMNKPSGGIRPIPVMFGVRKIEN